MNKEQKVNYVKCWLQKFGNRDNETFNTEVVVGETTWGISLQYNFDDEGEQCDPYDWCSRGFKHVHNNQISDRTDEELDEIINQLKIEVNASETQKYYKSKEVQDLDNPTDVVDEYLSNRSKDIFFNELLNPSEPNKALKDAAAKYKMKKGLKIYRVEFKGMYPVGNCLVLAAFNQEQAEEMAKKTITHTTEMVVNEMTINEPQVIEYLSGDY